MIDLAVNISGDVQGHNAEMTLKLIDDDHNHGTYNVEAEWTLDTNNPGFTRRGIFQLLYPI